MTSLIRVDKLYTLSQKLIIKHYGHLNEAIFNSVLKTLDDILGR